MSKHSHHQSNEEQRHNKELGSAPFHYDPYQDASKTDHFVTKDGAISLLAYQIHQSKGGSEMDNWLEAERIYKNNHSEFK